jgi:hypothetical protein
MSDRLTFDRLSKWQALEPIHRGYEIRLNAREGRTAWAVTIWSLKDRTATRWGVVSGYGETAEEARVDAFRRRFERIPPDEGMAFVDECLLAEEDEPDVTVTTSDFANEFQ